MRTGSYWEFMQVDCDQLRKMLRSGWVVVGNSRTTYPKDHWGTQVSTDTVMVKRHLRICDGMVLVN